MTYLRRAILYVARKRTKSLLLFLLLLVIAVLTLSGIAILGAVRTAQLNVRQALGGVFTLQQNTSDPDRWVSSAVGPYGSASYYGGAPLTVELAEYIQDSVEGIAGYNAVYTSYTVPLRQDGEPLELTGSGEEAGGLDSLLAGYGDFNATVSTYASTNTAYDGYFSGGYLELTAGRHFTAEDRAPALISQELAERNGLQVGDEITLRMSEFKASMMGYDAGETCAAVKIVGLFRATAKSTASLSNWSMDNSVFTTLEVVRRVRPDMGEESYEKISFYVGDPGQLEDIVERVRSLPDLDGADFAVSVDSSDVEAVTAPLANMDRLVSLLTALVLAIGGAVLCLALSARIRERIHESGVLLSLGLSKWNIMAQYLTEILLVAALAFPLSVLAGELFAGTAASQLLDYAAPESAQAAPAAAGSGISGDGVVISGPEDYAPRFEGGNKLTQIQVSVSAPAAAAVCGVEFLMICAAVLIAALPVLRMKPREIVSKMS